MAKLFENNGNPNQMPHFVVPDLVPTVCQNLPFWGLQTNMDKAPSFA